MPKVKPAVVTLRDGTTLKEGRDNIEYGPTLITSYAVEIQSVPTRKKRWWEWNKTATVQVQQQVKVPIMSWPYSQITHIEWGYIDKKTFDMIKAKMAEEALKKEKPGSPDTPAST